MPALRVVRAAAVCLVLLDASVAAAQEPPSAVAAAEAHRSRGEFAEAVRLLRAHLVSSPDDGTAARLLAETLYWLGDVPGARLAYETAIARHAEDTLVRLQFARMLMETGDRDEARAWLLAIRDSASGAVAETLLGTLAYWDGDLTAAFGLFESALRRDAGQGDARRQLEEIRAATSPWIRAGAVVRHDDQPLDRLAAGFEAGWFVTPLTPVVVRLDPTRFRFSGTTRDLRIGEVEASHASPHGFGAAAAAGLLMAGDGRQEVTARARFSVRPSPGAALGVEASRAPYLWTTSSLATPVMPTTVRVFSTVATRGFDAEAAVERDSFQDGNAVTSAYAWVLAPVARSRRVTLQAGYAFSAEDAAESRFVLAFPDQAAPPGSPAFDTSGRYDPYYTPEQRRTHAALSALTVRSDGGARLHLSGSYALRTSELAPELIAAGSGTLLLFVPRSSHPWEARAIVEVPLHSRVRLEAGAAMGRKPFYDWRGGAVSLVYRLRPGPESGRPGGR